MLSGLISGMVEVLEGKFVFGAFATVVGVAVFTVVLTAGVVLVAAEIVVVTVGGAVSVFDVVFDVDAEEGWLFLGRARCGCLLGWCRWLFPVVAGVVATADVVGVGKGIGVVMVAVAVVVVMIAAAVVVVAVVAMLEAAGRGEAENFGGGPLRGLCEEMFWEFWSAPSGAGVMCEIGRVTTGVVFGRFWFLLPR